MAGVPASNPADSDVCAAKQATDVATLNCLSERMEALSAERRYFFRVPRRLAIAGGVSALALAVVTATLVLSSDSLFDEYAERPKREERWIQTTATLSVVAGTVALAGLAGRISAGIKGTPVDGELRAVRRRRSLLMRDFLFKTRERGATAALSFTF